MPYPNLKNENVIDRENLVPRDGISTSLPIILNELSLVLCL